MSKTHAANEIIECPCYRICRALDIETGIWCRYRKSQVPPVGLHRFDPKESWCPPGVQANLMLLAYILTRQGEDHADLQEALSKARAFAAQWRAKSDNYDPSGPTGQRP